MTSKDFKFLLPWFRTVTEEYQNQMGEWSLEAQINHIFTEVGELNNALRKNKPLNDVLGEIWDIVLSAITVSHLIPDATDEKMFEAFDLTMEKLLDRMANNHYKREGKEPPKVNLLCLECKSDNPTQFKMCEEHYQLLDEDAESCNVTEAKK